MKIPKVSCIQFLTRKEILNICSLSYICKFARIFHSSNKVMLSFYFGKMNIFKHLSRKTDRNWDRKWVLKLKDIFSPHSNIEWDVCNSICPSEFDAQKYFECWTANQEKIFFLLLCTDLNMLLSFCENECNGKNVRW